LTAAAAAAQRDIEIFKPGRHTAMSGQTLSFAASDLAATADAYDPSLFEAPLVVGHPTLDAPAYGWVKSVAVGDAGKLVATPHQLDAQFAEMVGAGRFKKVSASFFAPDAPNNPKPGVWYLRHVGFLGAAAPAVTGLKPVQFAAEAAGVVTVEFSDWDIGWGFSTIARGFQRLREAWIAQFGQDAADKAVPSDMIDSLSSAADSVTRDATIAAVTGQDADDVSAGGGPAPAFADATQPEAEVDAVTKEELAAQQAALKADQERLARERAEFAAQRRIEDATAFVGDLVTAGKVLPREKAELVAFMAGLAPEETVEFAAGDGTQVTKPRVEILKGFLKGLPKRVDFAERTAAGDAGAVVNFADSTAIADAAAAVQKEMAEKGTPVSAATAVQIVKQRGAQQ